MDRIVEVMTDLEHPNQSTRCQEPSFVFNGSLGHCYDRPSDHLNGYPAVGSEFLGNELRRKLRQKKRNFKDGIAEIEVLRINLVPMTKSCTRTYR